MCQWYYVTSYRLIVYNSWPSNLSWHLVNAKGVGDVTLLEEVGEAISCLIVSMMLTRYIVQLIFCLSL